MIAFDDILPVITTFLREDGEALGRLAPLVINRDLNGRVRLIVKESLRETPEAEAGLSRIGVALSERLGPHGVPPERLFLFEPEFDTVYQDPRCFPLDGIDGVKVVDRLAGDGDWLTIRAPTAGPPRVVFFSIKGGVGRSTALAATAWSLAERGRRVLVLDADLESPGLSSSLLPEDRRPRFGVTDWLVEDLVDNGDRVLKAMIATSALSYNGEIHVVPAHGEDPGDYVSKLGRVWMPKMDANGRREPWGQRLRRLLDGLEQHVQPDVVLIDSRAGIDEVASTCVTDLGAALVLMFALEGEQTWSGYRILFRHWRRVGAARAIRERLQMVGAMIPETESKAYFASLLERSWTEFSDELYDEIPPEASLEEDFPWNFDEKDDGAPHYPWSIRWHRGFSALRSLHQRFSAVDGEQVRLVFGRLLDGVEALAPGPSEGTAAP